MDPFYTFLVFAGVLVFEQLAARMWLPAYYRFGLPIFITRRNRNQRRTAGEMAQTLEGAFGGRAEHPTIRFRPLDERVIAIHETLFENRGGFRYFPIMHSVLQVPPEKNAIQVTGYINAYILVALVYLVYRACTETGFLPVAFLILFVLGVSYAAQSGINRRIVEEAARLQNHE